MSLLGKMAKLDSSLQRGLDNSFAFVFGGKVVPAEIEEALRQEAEDNVTKTYEGTVEVPNVFRVSLSSKDICGIPDEAAADFADHMTRLCRNNGWSVPGPIRVDLVEDSSLRSGQLKTSSSSEAQPQTVTLLLQDGSSRTYAVHEGSNIIGRGQQADFRLPDTGVSRQHAEVTWDGRDAVLVDLQSTNGTTVNDMKIDNWLLGDGDVITVGHSQLEVRITGR